MEFDIKFRPLKLEDARFINELRRLDDMEKLIGGSSRPVSYERDVKWVEGLMLNDNQSMIYWAITTVESDDIIGYTSISNIDYRNGSCFWSGIKLDQRIARKGLGLQTGLKIIKYAFEEMRMLRLTAECQEEHTAAFHMLLKLGYVQEGLMRKTLFKNGVSNNQWLFSIIDDEYKAIKEKFQL